MGALDPDDDLQVQHSSWSDCKACLVSRGLRRAPECTQLWLQPPARLTKHARCSSQSYQVPSLSRKSAFSLLPAAAQNVVSGG